MKKYILKGFAIIVIFSIFLCLSGCFNSQEYAILRQDEKMTGGNLTYNYQIENQMLTVGGEGETILLYSKNEIKGWSEDGCRIGIQFVPPKNIANFEAIEVTIENEKQQPEFLYINNENTGIFTIYPLIDNTEKIYEIFIKWSNNSEQQKYKLKILEGTQLMKKESTI